ncbi:enoyl-CoA hydratase-related protein [Nocardia xishanensis]|uniref:enoyl-CoA hydratase-related protein n=1 Tax=Nocardia xishanensis TaxID=238964 RepID=UPI0033D943D6
MTIDIIDAEPGIRVLSINRPATRNAFDLTTYSALADNLVCADSDPDVNVVIITGTGGVFTSGNDMADFRDQKGSDEALALLHALVTADTPVIAAVEGFAIGIGTTLLLHCDLAFAGRSTVFAVPFVQLGLSAEGGSTLLLPRTAGPKHAAEMLLLGEKFDVHRAEAAGLINRVVDDGAAYSAALEAARSLWKLPTQAVLDTKRLLRRDRAEILRVIEEEAVVFRRRAESPEALAAFQRFFTPAP